MPKKIDTIPKIAVQPATPKPIKNNELALKSSSQPAALAS